MWLPCIWSQFEPETQKSRECGKLAGGTDCSGSSYKDSWPVDDKG